MKRLYLLRHADAQIITQDGDFKRSISIKGIQELEKLTAFLLFKDLKIDAVFCSPAFRTKQSWEFLNSKLSLQTEFKFVEELYNPLAGRLVNFIYNMDDNYNSILIISHNPVISQTANNLLVVQGRSLNFFTCNMACITFDLAKWSEVTNNCGKLEWLYT